MPHVTIATSETVETLMDRPLPGVERWGRAVLKMEQLWRRGDGEAVLVEGVVVEFSRPLHPVARIAPHERGLIVRLWPLVPVERTEAVQRWLAGVAEWARSASGGEVRSANLAPAAVAGYPWSDRTTT